MRRILLARPSNTRNIKLAMKRVDNWILKSCDNRTLCRPIVDTPVLFTLAKYLCSREFVIVTAPFDVQFYKINFQWFIIIINIFFFFKLITLINKKEHISLQLGIARVRSF